MFIIEKDFFIRSILGSSEEEIKRVRKSINDCYKQYEIPKKGGKRQITAVDKEKPLARLQANLTENFLNKLSLPTPVVGFVQDKSYIDFLSPHIGKKYFLRLDIKDFFGSIHGAYIHEQFEEYFADNCKECIDYIVSLCTYDDMLPQGAITSPAISNVVFRRVDQRILKYCQSFDSVYINRKKVTENIIYTRYADDLLFSSDSIDFSKQLYFMGMIRKILKDSSFGVNEKKVRFGTNEISLSGYVLSSNIHLSRKKLYAINRLIHYFGKTDNYANKKYRIRKNLFSGDWIKEINDLNLKDGRNQLKQFKSAADVLNYLCGYRAFLISIIRANTADDGNVVQLKRKVKKLEDIICAVSEHCS